jgi:3-oxoacyl-[acyl-carrier protein] reductase
MSMRELDGKVALVTGGARNIGRAIALELADGGAAVAIVVRTDITRANAVAREVEARGGQALAIRADITDPSAVKQAVDETIQRFTRLDILVNNAGVRPEAPLEQLSLEAWRQVMAVTLEGPLLLVQAALRTLEHCKGSIINIGGMTAYTGAARRAHVVTAKAGLDGLTKALAVELAERDITVNLVAPGLIDTERDGPEPEHRKTRTTLLGRRGRPEDVAAAVRYLAGPNARYLTGQTIHVNGGAFLKYRDGTPTKGPALDPSLHALRGPGLAPRESRR